MTFTFSLKTILLVIILPTTTAHTRLECPPSRSVETGAKGPSACDAPDDGSLPAFPLTPGALNTITWLESVSHPGAPARFALSRDGDDSVASFESCLLLDHVPHDEYSLPVFTDENTWHRSSITLWIPDVFCERCHLQLLTVMSDEVHGVPLNASCAYAGALEHGTVEDPTFPPCPVVYHSCAPVSINGTVPRNNIDHCNTTEFEQKLDWPMTKSVNGDMYAYSTYYYKGNPGLYNQSTSRLLAMGDPIQECSNLAYCDPQTYFKEIMVVPDDAKYTAMEGTCADIVRMQVEPFQLGVLPSTPKNDSTPFVPPTAEEVSCILCEGTRPCFSDGGCLLRNEETKAWTGPAAPCNQFAPPCEHCFPDSACLFNSHNTAPEEEGNSTESMAPTSAAAGAEASPKVALFSIITMLGVGGFL